jgi:hypothetical protein
MTLSSGRVLRGLAFAGAAAAGYAFGVTSDTASAQPAPPGMLPPGMAQPPMPQPQPPKAEADRRVVGYLYGNVPITREELGDFLIARGGHEKLELLANKRIIEIEAQRRNVTVTAVEIKAKLEENLRTLGVSLKDFEEKVLSRHNKSLYEYVEDVIKPEMIMTKMCRDRVKVSDEDIQKTFENRFGERRQAKIICWNREDTKAALKQWEEARKGDAQFDAVARTQADPNLAAACGLTKPVGKHLESENDAAIVKALYSLKVGEISGIVETKAGLLCVKCVAILPPDSNAKLDDKMKTAISAELFQKKLEAEIPKFFHELRKAAAPNLILTGPPSAAEFREGVRELEKQALQNTGGVPMVPPMQK